MMNGQIVAAMTGTEAVVAAVVLLVAASAVGRFLRKAM